MKNRRDYARLIDPSAQFRFFIPFFILIALNLVISGALFWRIGVMKAELRDMNSLDPATLSALFSDFQYREGLILVIGDGLFGLLSLFLWLSYSRRIFGPVFTIQRQIDRLRGGDFSERLTLRELDELKPLADAVNGLAETLAERAKTSSN